MRFQLDQPVIVNGKKGVVYNYNIRYGEYTILYDDGKREIVKEDEISIK